MSSSWRNHFSLQRIGIAAIAGILGGIVLTDVAVESFMLHSNLVTLNYYVNGTADWAMDATALVKSFFVLLLVAFSLGTSLGLLIAKEKRKDER